MSRIGTVKHGREVCVTSRAGFYESVCGSARLFSYLFQVCVSAITRHVLCRVADIRLAAPAKERNGQPSPSLIAGRRRKGKQNLL